MKVQNLKIIGKLPILNDCLDLISEFEDKLFDLITERYALKNGNFMFKIAGDENFPIQFEFIKEISLLYPELLFVADKIQMVKGSPFCFTIQCSPQSKLKGGEYQSQ